jgi:hypothetical protein
MAYEYPGAGALDYSPCSYGGSTLLFRGPMAHLDRPYVAVLGGTATYGRFVQYPFPTLLADHLGHSVANLGIQNAGLDVFLDDETILDIARRAAVVVLQVPGALNHSNRFYSVHPRRNDRFLAASPALRALYPKVDFTEFAFTRHLMAALLAADADRFTLIRQELRAVWQERMSALLSRLPPNVVLIRLRHLVAPPGTVHPDLESEPLFVDDRLLSRVRIKGAEVVEITASQSAMDQGLGEMFINATEASQAALLPNPAYHREIADRLFRMISDRLKN